MSWMAGSCVERKAINVVKLWLTALRKNLHVKGMLVRAKKCHLSEVVMSGPIRNVSVLPARAGAEGRVLDSVLVCSQGNPSAPLV